MNPHSLPQRSLRSLLAGRTGATPRPTVRGRAGHPLWRRVWASFIGADLPSGPAGPLVAGTPVAVAPGRSPQGEVRPGDPLPRPLPGWFALPALSTGGALTAAGGDAVVLEAGSPDGGIAFLVRTTGGGEPSYGLELVVHGDGHVLPLMCVTRYTGRDGRGRELLVPVARATVGPSASYVGLPGFGPGTAWTASVVPVGPEPGWARDVVAASVAAARNEATREAWRQVRERVDESLRDVIDGALR